MGMEAPAIPRVPSRIGTHTFSIVLNARLAGSVHAGAAAPALASSRKIAGAFLRAQSLHSFAVAGYGAFQLTPDPADLAQGPFRARRILDCLGLDVGAVC